MRLLRLSILLLLATILIAEPVVHSHPLTGNDGAGIASPTVCALCAVAAQQITVVRTNIAAPSVVADLLVAAAPLPRSLNERRPLASRAPPAA
ncbi:MAG TPA: hypothetical protein VGQ65_19185 [Thermoanaerobaculia bacterium]|jgi:hypothetical protein|nr:hypothetical protein [Thermoanaerobaculia bacterium]